MRLTGSLLSAVGLACLVAACSGEPNAVPTGPSPFTLDAAEHHAPGHAGGGGSGGGGGGRDNGINLTFSGNITSAAQAATIDRDTKFTLKILAGVDNGVSEFYDAFQLSSGVDLGECVVDPPGAPTADVIARLDDPYQARDRVVIQIDKRNLGSPGGGILYHNWDDDLTGVGYRTWLKESELLPGVLVTVTNPTDDEYVFSGGSIVSWNTSTNVAIACPFTGSITVNITPS